MRDETGTEEKEGDFSLHLPPHLCMLISHYAPVYPNNRPGLMIFQFRFVSDIAIFVLKRDVKLQLTNWLTFSFDDEDRTCVHRSICFLASCFSPRDYTAEGKTNIITTARRNARIASALLATAIPSVRLSVTRRYCVKTTARSTVQFALSYSKNVSIVF